LGLCPEFKNKTEK